PDMEAENPRVGGRLIVHLLRDATEGLVTPDEAGRGFLGDNAHRLSKESFTLSTIKLLLFFKVYLIHLGIGIVDSRSHSSPEMLVKRRTGIEHLASSHVIKRDLASLDVGPKRGPFGCGQPGANTDSVEHRDHRLGDLLVKGIAPHRR